MRAFLGRRVFNLLVLSVLVGFVLSAVEVGFSVLIQSFLLSLDVLDPRVANVPDWAPRSFMANLASLGLFAALRGLIQWFKVYSHAMSNEGFAYHLKTRIAEWALLSNTSSSAQVVTLINDRVQSGANYITGVQNACVQLLSLTLILGYLFKSAPALAAAGLGLLLFFGLLLKGLDRKIKSSGTQLAETSLAINERLLDSMKNLQFLKISRADGRELGKIRADLDKFFRNIKTFSMVKSWKFAAPQFSGVLIIMMIAAYNKQEQLLTGGAFISFIYLFLRCAQTLSDLSTSFAGLRMYRPQFEDLKAWWRAQAAAPARADRGTESAFRGEKLNATSWKMSAVSFGYDAAPVLTNLALETPAGGITVVTGASGIGKSTLLHLMSGLLQPRAGTVEVNGKFRSLEEALRENAVRFGYVGPDPHVISGTIRENLMYGLDYAPSETDIRAALEQAHCLEFLPELPRDLERRISDRGDGLSTGQKQRLSLARALLRKPSALLLDEPTANLDALSASNVVEALKRLRGQVSMVIVTHHKPLHGIADKVVEF